MRLVLVGRVVRQAHRHLCCMGRRSQHHRTHTREVVTRLLGGMMVQQHTQPGRLIRRRALLLVLSR